VASYGPVTVTLTIEGVRNVTSTAPCMTPFCRRRPQMKGHYGLCITHSKRGANSWRVDKTHSKVSKRASRSKGGTRRKDPPAIDLTDGGLHYGRQSHSHAPRCTPVMQC
jgi:hypothetical protein